MKKFLSLALVVILILSLIPTTAVFAVKKETLTQLALTVTAPKEGAKPTYDKIDGRGYYSDNGLNGTSTRIYKNGIAWFKSASSYFSPGTTATFEGNKNYTVKINLLAKGNFEFSKNVTATINGKTATVDYNDNDGSVTVSAALTSTADTKTAISKIELNVVKPVIGKYPTFAKVDTTQYVSEKYGSVSNCSNGVTWTNQSNNINITVSNLFKEGTKYRVTYYLTAKDGYKFTSGTICTINGSAASISVTDATHAKVSLSDLVPGDGKKEISSLDISVPAPKDGAKPDYTKIDGNGYYSDNGLNGVSTRIYKNGIAWYKSTTSFISPGTTETFKGDSEYTLKISLLPKDGYKFVKTLSAKINGKAATVETFDDGSITVSAKFTALSKNHKHTSSGWKNDATNHWKICTDANCGSLTVAKAAHTDKNKDNKCDVCAYAIPKTATSSTNSTAKDTESSATTSSEKNTDTDTATEPEDTVDTDTNVEAETDEAIEAETENNKKDADSGNNLLIWIILGVVILALIAVIVILVLKSKKAK